MSINNITNGGSISVDQQRIAQSAEQNKPAVADKATTNATDSVELTNSAQQLTKLQAKAMQAPVDKEKVAALRDAIISGEYRVDPDALASKIAKFENDIFGA